MEKQGKNNNVLKNAAIVVLVGTTALLGVDAYRQHDANIELQGQVLEMGVKLDENALETQNTMEAFAEIEINLAEIRESEGYLLTNLDEEEFEGEFNSQKRILGEIASIEHLIAENKRIIKDLESEVGEKDGRLAQYKKSVSSLEGRIADYKKKNEELIAQSEVLKNGLVQVGRENQQITQELALKECVVEEQFKQLSEKEKLLRTAYYTVGSFKQLRDNEIVEKEGGILGLGAAKTVKDDFNREGFTEIDIYDYTYIPVYSRDVEIVSNHDPKSYEYITEKDGSVRWILVTNPELFWESTKYLVVLSKGGVYSGTTAQAKF